MLAEENAIAVAVAAHLRRHPEVDGIYDVEVEDLGPVARAAQGAMALERGDLTDRSVAWASLVLMAERGRWSQVGHERPAPLL